MAWIEYNNKKYKMMLRKLQCLNCGSVVQGFDVDCDCGRVIIKNGKRTWPFFPIKDVSIWKNEDNDILPQSVLDYLFNLSREANKTSTNTKTSTSTS